ncbi:MAG: M61 family peptidase [Pseudomonadota bacterium]|nr:M61 family peptidase [Pseudomonadota bacterium]
MLNSRHWLHAAALSICLMFIGPIAHAASVTTVEVDARDAPRGIQRVHLVMPVKPGNLTLLYPKWLPGEHAPNGPIDGLSALKFTSGGKTLAWQRDAVDMYAFHLTVPANAGSLDVSFEVLAEHDAREPNAARLATDAVAIILWNQLMLYPAGIQSDDIQVAARLRLPAGWNFGTALPKGGTSGDAVQFGQVSLTTLIDSPVLAGRHFRTEELGGTPAVYLHLAADSAAALAIPDATTAQMRKLVQEATALFGATHYNEYHFLWSLSDQIDYEGIEHHQSSDNRSAERTLIDGDLRRSADAQTLLPHEYTHSWNGKYRRPIGLATGNYDSPMRGELLWVYEGLTEYVGMVLSARSGLASAADARDNWADTAASAQATQGREWRPLADTAISGPIIYNQAPEWRARTRAADFYGESALLWLEADTIIRSKSNGKSLDDFCKIFYGAPSTTPKVVPYNLDEVLKALNSVLPYDWRGFWSDRLNRVRAAAPLEGIKASGWRLVFESEPTPEQKGVEAIQKKTNLLFSLGFELRDEGAVIANIAPGSAADVAGVAPGSHLIAVDGRKYSKEVLQDALSAGGTEARTIKLLIQKDDMFNVVEVHYAGKARYPRLERDPSIPDLLSAITAPHVP